MLKKRIIISLTFLDGVLFRTKNFKPDYRYTKNFIDLWSIDELILIDISKKKFSIKFLRFNKIFLYLTVLCHCLLEVELKNYLMLIFFLKMELIKLC